MLGNMAVTDTTSTGWTWTSDHAPERRRLFAAVLWSLHLDGSAECDKGRARGVLVERLRARGVTDRDLGGQELARVSQVLRELEVGEYAGSIEREVVGRRTYSIALRLTEDQLPRNPFPAISAARNGRPTANGAPAPAPARPPEPTPAPAVPPPAATLPAPPPWNGTPPATKTGATNPRSAYVIRRDEPMPPAEPEPVRHDADPGASAADKPRRTPFDVLNGKPALDLLLMIQSAATAATLSLAEEAGRLAAAEHTAPDGETAERLASVLAENDRLRRKLRIAEETAAAKSKEADTIRRSLSVVQSNLDALREGAQVNDSGFRALRALQTETPWAKR